MDLSPPEAALALNQVSQGLDQLEVEKSRSGDGTTSCGYSLSCLIVITGEQFLLPAGAWSDVCCAEGDNPPSQSLSCAPVCTSQELQVAFGTKVQCPPSCPPGHW